SIQRLTCPGPLVWDCRASESPDGRSILFCRAETGQMPSVWLMSSNGGSPHPLTDGQDDQGADHPRWLP
ncbi:MAG TPA: serine/threonine protein kinase, partial [Verrucomicrobiota bacterium]|nr:serine/threonine protein kinase [Verrucomicrobiota bacterium]